jgi:Mg2+/Co2+ transporter CorB
MAGLVLRGLVAAVCLLPELEPWPADAWLQNVGREMNLSETAFVRMSRIRAIALEEEGNKRARRLVTMLEHPEQTLNVVLLLVLVSQLTSATLIGVLLEGTAGTLGVVLGIVLQIVLEP